MKSSGFHRGYARRTLIADPLRYRWNGCDDWVDMSLASRRLGRRLPELCFSRKPLLLAGECGSGREFLARLIHSKGPFPEAPFFHAENLPEQSCAASSNATVFLRLEKGQRLSEQLPAKELDVRLIAALDVPESGRETAEWLCAGEDGLTVVEVPPLRRRREDILLLVGCFLEQLAAERTAEVPLLSLEASAALISYCWPGNVRELRACMERAFCALEQKYQEGRSVNIHCLPPEIRGFVKGLTADNSGPGSACCSSRHTFAQRQEELEAEVLRMELLRQQGNITRTAQTLGLTPRQTAWRMKKYGIERAKNKGVDY